MGRDGLLQLPHRDIPWGSQPVLPAPATEDPPGRCDGARPHASLVDPDLNLINSCALVRGSDMVQF